MEERIMAFYKIKAVISGNVIEISEYENEVLFGYKDTKKKSIMTKCQPQGLCASEILNNFDDARNRHCGIQTTAGEQEGKTESGVQG